MEAWALGREDTATGQCDVSATFTGGVVLGDHPIGIQDVHESKDSETDADDDDIDIKDLLSNIDSGQLSGSRCVAIVVKRNEVTGLRPQGYEDAHKSYRVTFRDVTTAAPSIPVDRISPLTFNVADEEAMMSQGVSYYLSNRGLQITAQDDEGNEVTDRVSHNFRGVPGTGRINTSLDIDFFQTRLTAGQTYTLNVQTNLQDVYISDPDRYECEFTSYDYISERDKLDGNGNPVVENGVTVIIPAVKGGVEGFRGSEVLFPSW